MLKPLFALLVVLFASGPAPELTPAPIMAHSIPPLAESSWAFSDGGSFFLVGKTTGTVTIVRSGESAQVEPDRKPTPKPTPVAEFKPVAAFLFFDSKNFTVAQATIKNDVSLREAASRLGVPLYSVFSDESEFSGSTWQAAIKQTGTPCLVLLDKDNKPKTVKIQTGADVLEALK